MASNPGLTIRKLRVRAVKVPMPLPLQTSSGTITTAPLALIDLETEEGVTGCAYLFCYTVLAFKPLPLASLTTAAASSLLCTAAIIGHLSPSW